MKQNENPESFDSFNTEEMKTIEQIRNKIVEGRELANQHFTTAEEMMMMIHTHFEQPWWVQLGYMQESLNVAKSSERVKKLAYVVGEFIHPETPNVAIDLLKMAHLRAQHRVKKNTNA